MSYLLRVFHRKSLKCTFQHYFFPALEILLEIPCIQSDIDHLGQPVNLGQPGQSPGSFLGDTPNHGIYTKLP